MKPFYLFVAAILCSYAAEAQLLEQYQSSNNPYYWKNKLPDANYWQQDVGYKIAARIDESKHIIEASQTISYQNNSPDTLREVFLRLFQNAFVKGSYLHQLEAAVGFKSYLGGYEDAGLGTTVSGVTVNGKPATLTLDNTILKISLSEALLPQRSLNIQMNFTTYYDNGGTRRRMKMYPAWGFMHYNGVQWFPKMCVYDRKFGWDTYQHLNKEFYGEFGTYDVSLDFPSNYIVEATGELQNREEVLPKALREKLDIKNFANKKWNEPPSEIIPYKKGERKIWKFQAENVHDFAFTADPSYRIATTYWEGVECVGLAQEPHAAKWQNSADLVAKIIQTFSEDIGKYAYPKMIAADAADGMEYPMLTLDGGGEPGYRGLLIHEIGHNWFYGMVGSNETYRAAMDEGFTQFLTAWGLNKIDGENIKADAPSSKYRRYFYEPRNARDERVYNAYIATALRGDELPLNTHSNDFNNALAHENGYGMVYYKTATMLYNLQYVLGDSLFLAAMQHYFHQWKMAHPYFEDFKNSVIHFTKVDLNWFFDQWFETTKKIDYSVANIQQLKGKDSAAITFDRIGQMQMPIDFTVTDKKGQQQSYHIPNTWFEKITDVPILPKWYGWGKINESYTAVIPATNGIKEVIIDTSNRLADVYPLNNNKAKGLRLRPQSVALKLDGGLSNPTDRYKYRMYIRPDAWWNSVDGVKLGAHLEGNYLNLFHKIDAVIWWNTHFLQEDAYLSYKSEGFYERYSPVNFSFQYSSPISYNHPNHEEHLQVRYVDGLFVGKIGHIWKPQKNIKADFFFQSMWRQNVYGNDYLLYPNEWSSSQQRLNNSINLVLSRTHKTKNGTLYATATFRTPFLNGNEYNAFNYSYAQLEAKHYLTIKKLEIRGRIFARLGMGANLPSESILWLSGANPEEMMENKYTRSVGIVPPSWAAIGGNDINHFHQGGGLNLRGYAGYYVADEKNGDLLIGYKGRSGAAINIEVAFDNYINLRPLVTRNWLSMDVYLFADAGVIEMSRLVKNQPYYASAPTTTVSDFRMDAGLGFAATIKKWGVFEKAKPLTIRFDMPFFINRPPYASPDYLGFRYVIGINRAF